MMEGKREFYIKENRKLKNMEDKYKIGCLKGYGQWVKDKVGAGWGCNVKSIQKILILRYVALSECLDI